MKLRSALLIATFLTAPVVAMAQPVSGLYVAGGLGYNMLLQTNAKLRESTGPNTTYSTNTGNIRSNGGGIGIASIGYGLGNGLRIELEGSGMQQSTRWGGFPGVYGGGTVSTYGANLNAIYDFNVGLPIVPFVGIGGGYSQTTLTGYKLYNGGSSTVYSPNNSAKGGFTGVALLGASYNIPGVPGLAVTAEYRFEGLFQTSTFSGPVVISGVGNTNGTLKLQQQYNNAFLLGVRYAFNAPRPAVVAPTPVVAVAPAPAPARSYLVFFDWDKADLNARAQQIIAEAAQASTRVASTKIDVSGYADRTGTASYNQTLSMKRATNVAAELVRLGVPKTAIMINAYGDTRPLVPTGPGVREPQNRRVEIVLK